MAGACANWSLAAPSCYGEQMRQQPADLGIEHPDELRAFANLTSFSAVPDSRGGSGRDV